MTRAALCAAVGLVCALAAGPRANAARDATHSAWLDADAPVVVSLRPSLLSSAAAALARGRDGHGRQLALGVEAARAGSIAAFGADLFERTGWIEAGFDPAVPVLASIAAIDAARTGPIFDQLFSFHEWTDAKLKTVRKTFWRSRAVVAISDATRATETVRALAAFSSDLYSVDKRYAAELAMMLGGSERKAKSVVDRLRARKILAIGWLEGVDAVIAFRVLPKRKLLLIDVVGSFAGVPAVWSRDSKKLLAAIERNPGTSKLPAALARGVGADALAADFGIWVQPEALLALAKASARNDALRSLALTKPGKVRRRELHRRAAEEVESCELLRPLVERGPLLDVAMTLETDANGLRGRVAWGLRKGAKLAAALAVRDDGLLAWPGPQDAVVVAAHYLRSLRGLRALPRPRVMSKGFDELDAVLDTCGSSASFVTSLFGWHALLAMTLDELRADEPALAAAVDGAGNGALALRALGRSDGDAIGAIALSFDDDGATALATALHAARGAGSLERFGAQRVTLWRGDSPEPFRFAPAAGVTAFGATLGSTALAWYLGAAGSSADPPIARWRVSVPALVERASDLPGWLRAVASHIDRIDGRVTITRHTLAAELVPTLR